MNVLVTGSRAPASMDLIRSLVKQGHQVYSADSMHFPMGRFVSGLKKHITIPKPNRQFAGFIQAIKTIITNYHIDLLIPTCEEIFFISQAHDELSRYTRVFCEPFARLNLLHNKYRFQQLVLEYGLNAPESWLLSTDEDKQKIALNQDIILKPVFSRFGSHLIIKPSSQQLNELVLKVPYLAQRFIKGKEYCAYALVDKGQVLAYSCYHPKYTAGPAAGIYFEPVQIAAITAFIHNFCQQYNFNGQIAFDFILEKDKAFVLECNPRITSGYHFLADHVNWSTLLQGTKQAVPLMTHPYMLGLGMKLHGFRAFKNNPQQVINDYRRAHDLLKNKSYPWLGLKSIATLGNIALRMLKERKNFHQASTDDIEFNG